jgi:hypothetical protein
MASEQKSNGMESSARREFKVVFEDIHLTRSQSETIQKSIHEAISNALAEVHLEKQVGLIPVDSTRGLQRPISISPQGPSGQSSTPGTGAQGVDAQGWFNDFVDAVAKIAPVVIEVVKALDASPQGPSGQSSTPAENGAVSPAGWLDGIFPSGWLRDVTAGFIARPLNSM